MSIELKAAIVEEKVVVARLGIDELPYPESSGGGGEGESVVEASSPAKARLRMTMVEGDNVANTFIAKAVLREPVAGDSEGEGSGLQ
ncbi:hypothetical protein, partial [Bacillus sp. GbtcB13]|uniref:hypothetical protein n=1 Tax=Bacillus sp. GbtcB13 TaxID=2824758 RepID=UPI001C301104